MRSGRSGAGSLIGRVIPTVSQGEATIPIGARMDYNPGSFGTTVGPATLGHDGEATL